MLRWYLERPIRPCRNTTSYDAPTWSFASLSTCNTDMNVHAHNTYIEREGAHLLPALDLTVIPKRRVGAKQPRIGMAAILQNDALCLLFARGPCLLERIARAKELFPTIRVPCLEF